MPWSMPRCTSSGTDSRAAFSATMTIVDPSVFAYRDGHVAIPQGPGLGIEVNEDFVRRAAAEGHRWRNPIWCHADGSFAEW